MNNRDIMENSAGYNGFEYISDTAVHSAPQNQVFTSIQVTASATITSLVSTSLTGNNIVGAVIPAGTTILGRFSSVSFSAGTAIAYKGV